MTTAIVLFYFIILSFFIVPWIGYLNHSKFHKTDSMAGDEGE